MERLKKLVARAAESLVCAVIFLGSLYLTAALAEAFARVLGA